MAGTDELADAADELYSGPVESFTEARNEAARQAGDKALGARCRVGGDVESGTIQRVGSEVQFVLTQEQTKLKVAYAGSDPLPDTFKGGAQALANDGITLRALLTRAALDAAA